MIISTILSVYMALNTPLVASAYENNPTPSYGQAVKAPRKAVQRHPQAPRYLTKGKPTRAVAPFSWSGNDYSGIASYYWQGSKTANGEAYRPDGISCAHRTAKFGTMLTVTDVATGRSVTCRVNDRGPFIKGRIVDLSRGAAKQLGITGKGLARVIVN